MAPLWPTTTTATENTFRSLMMSFKESMPDVEAKLERQTLVVVSRIVDGALFVKARSRESR
jgi:hypothetical protein